MRSLLLVESFDYILVRVIPSCFRFEKMCLCQVSLLSRCSPRYLISSSWGSCTLFTSTGGGGGHVSLPAMNVTWINLDPLAFILHFLTNCRLQVSWFIVCVKQWLDHCPWQLLQYRRRRLLWSILVRSEGLQCIAGIIMALGHCLRAWTRQFQHLRESLLSKYDCRITEIIQRERQS
jgi:hypothetical protein